MALFYSVKTVDNFIPCKEERKTMGDKQYEKCKNDSEERSELVALNSTNGDKKVIPKKTIAELFFVPKSKKYDIN